MTLLPACWSVGKSVRHITVARILLLIYTLSGICIGIAHSQIQTSAQTSLYPFGSFSGSSIDNVDVASGALNIHIPLFSLPQKGKLAMSFSMLFNSNQFHSTLNCSSEYQGCLAWYVHNTTLGAHIIWDQSMGFGEMAPQQATSFTWYTGTIPSTINYTVSWYTAQDGDGQVHTLGYDNANVNYSRATDGSGYTFHATGYSDPSLYVVSEGILSNATGVSIPICLTCPPSNDIQMSDLMGNMIHSGYSSTVSDPWYSQKLFQYTDSVGRVIPWPAAFEMDNSASQVANSTANCPNLGIQDQPATASVIWSVPGPNGTVNYTVCYAEVSWRTEFWGVAASIPDGNNFPISQNPTTQVNNPTNASSILPYDLDGVDEVIQSIVLPDNTYYGFIYDSGGMPLNPSHVGYEDLKELILPSGGSISYTYTNKIVCMPAAGDPWLNVNRQISARTVNDGKGHISTWTYNDGVVTDPNGNDTAYTISDLGNGGCDMYTTDVKQYQGSQSGGQVLEEKVTTYQSVSDPQTYYFPNASKAMNVVPKTVQLYKNGSLSTTTTYGYQPLFTDTQLVCTGSGPDCTWGLQIANVVYPQPSDIQVTDVSRNLLSHTCTDYEFAHNSNYYNANIIGPPYETLTLNSSGQVAAGTWYGYDESPSPQGQIGNQTSIHQLQSASGAVTNCVSSSETDITTLSTAYNSIGTVHTTKDALGNTTTYTSDSTGLFPQTVQYPSTANGAAHTVYYTNDPNTGQHTSYTDQNGTSPRDSAHTTHYSYDSMYRVIGTTYPDSGSVTTIYSSPVISFPSDVTSTQGSGYYPTTVNPAATETTTVAAMPDPSMVSSRTYDGLGRPLYSRAANGAYTADGYDLVGNLCAVSNPSTMAPPTSGLSCSAGQNPSSSDSTDGIIYMSYDPLGRLQVKTQQDGNAQFWTYNVNTVTVKDENGNLHEQVSDGLGRLVQVLEPDGSQTAGTSPTLETDYGYDALGNLSRVNQWGVPANTPGARVRTFSYDMLSRLICASNPENSSALCPIQAGGSYTAGTTGHSYFANGAFCSGNPSLPCSKTDARGSTVYYAYDGLNRLTAKTYSDSSPAACYQYDTPATNGIGLLAIQWTQAGSCPSSGGPPAGGVFTQRSILAYDAMGRVWNENQITFKTASNKSTYSLAYRYDLAGNLVASTDGTKPVSSPNTQFPCTPSSDVQNWTTLAFVNCYDEAGRTSSVISNWTAWPTNLFTAGSTNGYYPAGQLWNWTQGTTSSGTPALSVTQTYANRLWLNGITATGQVP